MARCLIRANAFSGDFSHGRDNVRKQMGRVKGNDSTTTVSFISRHKASSYSRIILYQISLDIVESNSNQS